LSELDASDPPDPVLGETAQIMADWALLPSNQYGGVSQWPQIEGQVAN